MAGAALGLALGSALMWGVADFLGGSSARRAPALAVSLWAQTGGLVAAWLYVAASGNWVEEGAMGWALAAGGVGAAALALFYAALSSGAMSIVAPLSACGAVIPVAIALIGGESPGTLGYAGMLAALVGAVLASVGGEEDHPTRLSPRALTYAIGAAAGIGLCVALLQQAGADDDTDPIAVVAIMRAAGVPVLIALVAGTRTSPALPRAVWPAVAVVALFDGGANAMFAAASGGENDSVVAVLGSLYPLTTVLLAAFLLRERPHRVQVAGVGLALIGVALIAGR